MNSTFLLYGAYGYVGEAITRMAIARGLRPVLAGRNATKVAALAGELGLEQRSFSLDDSRTLQDALAETGLVLHCAGPYIHTYRAMVDGCLQTGAHYLDLTGEIAVFEAIAARDREAQERGVMLLPGAGFDVTPTDCLALHLKQRLPSATRLTLAFKPEGPAGMPPGTQRTGIELLPYGDRVRRDGALERPEEVIVTRQIDFGRGTRTAIRFTWGDVFTAYYSTGIPNIEVYVAIPERLHGLLRWRSRLRPLFEPAIVRNVLKKFVLPGSSGQALAQSRTHVWGEVRDEQGGRAVSRLHGPEAGVVWTGRAALAAVQRVLAGDAPPGYQTPAKAYGADFALAVDGVTREDVLDEAGQRASPAAPQV